MVPPDLAVDYLLGRPDTLTNSLLPPVLCHARLHRQRRDLRVGYADRHVCPVRHSDQRPHRLIELGRLRVVVQLLAHAAWLDAGREVGSAFRDSCRQPARGRIPRLHPPVLARDNIQHHGGSEPANSHGRLVRDERCPALQSSPATVWLDAGSPYSILNPLSSSSTSERWETTGTTSGTLQGQAAATYVFYHQFLMTASFSGDRRSAGGHGSRPVLYELREPNIYPADRHRTDLLGRRRRPLLGPPDPDRFPPPPAVYTENTQGTVQASSSLSFGYTHQFLLSATRRGGQHPVVQQQLDRGGLGARHLRKGFGLRRESDIIFYSTGHSQP